MKQNIDKLSHGRRSSAVVARQKRASQIPEFKGTEGVFSDHPEMAFA
jgi:hypothetical protein